MITGGFDTTPHALAAILVAASLIACKPKEAAPPAGDSVAPATAQAPATAFSVTRIDLGTRIGADKQVTQPTTTFGPRDTIYAAVATEGSLPNATVVARWTYHGGQTARLVQADSQIISPTGPTVTEFHVARPDGWPAGKYQVEVLLNGIPAGVKEFEVRG